MDAAALPSSILGLALFIVLLAPGLAFVLRHERVVPARSYSAFREALRVIFVSVACLIITGLFAVGLRWLLPSSSTPNVRLLVQHPGVYVRQDYVQIGWWTLLLIAIATAFGAAAADPRVIRLQRKLAQTKAMRKLTGTTDTSISDLSAWYRLAHFYDDDKDSGPVAVGAQLDDGTYVEGWLFFYNVASEEDENREMVLSAPLHVTTQDRKRHEYGAQYTVISARHITRLDVTHTKPTDAARDAPATA